MKKDNEFKLANIIWNHWQNGTLIDNITAIDDIAPKDRTDGYKVQKYFSEFSNKDIFGWKIVFASILSLTWQFSMIMSTYCLRLFPCLFW